jgi:plastocyanin
MQVRIAIAIAAITVGTYGAQAQDPAPRVHRIDIEHHQYNGGRPVTVRVGDSVVWVNKDKMAHSASRYTDPENSDLNKRIFDGFNTGFIQPGQESAPIRFLKATDPAGVEYGCDVHDDPAAPMTGQLIVTGTTVPDHVHHEHPSMHSLIVMGEDPAQLFMHHFSLFNNSNHTYHVTVEGKIDDPAARAVYQRWRAANKGYVNRATVDLGAFLLSEIKPGTGTHSTFKGTFSESEGNGPVSTQWGTVIPGLEEVSVTITRVIQFRPYDPDAKYPERLTYQLFGNSKEVFLAHEVTEAPSFLHLVRIAGVPSFLTEDIIRNAPLVTFTTKSISRAPARHMKMGVLSNSTHLLLSPPINTINPEPPLLKNEEVDVVIGSDMTLRKLVIEAEIFKDFRILNR